MSMMLLWPPLASSEFLLFSRSKNNLTTKENKSMNNNLRENTHFFFIPTKILEKPTSALQSNPKSYFDHSTVAEGAS
jgi:hypothetical protein